MDAEPLICSTCRGKRYPRQCRNSAAWRKAQHAPADCPFGVELDGLPIGDNMPAGALLRPFPAKRQECSYADRAGCCKIRCTHPAGEGLTFVNAHCTPERCRHFEDSKVMAHV